MEENNRGNLYSTKYAKTLIETKEGNTLGIIDNDIQMKGVKFEELSDWNKIKHYKTKSINENKDNQLLLKAEVYCPIIQNENLFQNKAFRCNKDSSNSTINNNIKEDQLNAYSVNTSMFTYQNSMNNCDKIDLSVGSNFKMNNNSNSNIPKGKSNTRRYKSGTGVKVVEGNINNTNQQQLHKQISNYDVTNPIKEEESPKKISPIELLDNSNNYIVNKERNDDNNEGEYDEIKEQILKAKQLIADLEKDSKDIDSDSLSIGSKEDHGNKEEKEEIHYINKQSEALQPISTVSITKANAIIQPIIQDSKSKIITKTEEKPYILKVLEQESNKLKKKAQAKLSQEQKLKDKKKIDVKIIDKQTEKTNPMSTLKENLHLPFSSVLSTNTNINTSNYTPLSIENYQYTTNVMIPYQNMGIPYTMQQQQQHLYNQQLIDYSNQMQYQQQLQQQYIVYQQQLPQQQINPYQYYPYPIMNMPLQYPISQHHEQYINNTKPIAQIKQPPIISSSKIIKEPLASSTLIQLNNYPKSTPTPTPTPRQTSLCNNNIKQSTQSEPQTNLILKELPKSKEIETIKQPPQVNPTKTGIGYNHLQLLKNIKQNSNTNADPKIIPKKKSKKQTSIEEPQIHNKIYTTFKQPTKKTINNERITSAKTSIINNTTTINNTTATPINSNGQIKDLNELLNNHFKYNEQVAKIKETINDSSQ